MACSCPTPNRRLNISHSNPDSILTKALDAIMPPHDEFRVEGDMGTDGVEGVIKGVLRQGSNADFVMLDLIAHASSDGILQLGAWAVSSGQQLAISLRKLPALKLCGIRLLGCNTAATDAGRDAMRFLAGQFRTCVWGATGPIGAKHFTSDGFIDSTILTCDEDLPPPSPTPPEPSSFAAIALRRQRWLLRFTSLNDLTLDRAIGSLRLETLAEASGDRILARADLRWPVTEVDAADFRMLFDCVDPSLASAPGLLALPDCEIVTQVPMLGVPRFQRVTILLGGAFLRMYPRDRPEGIIVRIDPHHDNLIRDILRRGADALIPRRRPPIRRPRIVRR